MTLTIDEVEELLNEIASEIPEDIYKNLNGGILLLDEEKIHPQAVNDDLYILGTYNKNKLGSYINIYYGSLVKAYQYMDKMQMKEKLREVLYHEFTHHLENMAGSRDLEVEDERQIIEYKRSKNIG